MLSADEKGVSQHHQRLMDVAGEPTRMLPPIHGYADKPLVSLNQAVQWLTGEIPDITEYALEAQKKCFNSPQDGLTIDESASIILYTQQWDKSENSLYRSLNKVLRDANRAPIVKYFAYMKLLITALCKLPSSPGKFYRGVKFDLWKQFTVGQTVTWWAFSSCTSDPQVLESDSFLGKSGERTQFDIDCYSAKGIRKYSFFEKESEFLLMAATQFKVISSMDAGHGLHIVQLKEIEPKFPLIEKPSIVDGTQVEWTRQPENKDPPKTTQPKPVPPPGTSDSNERSNALKRRIGRYQLRGEVNLDDQQLTDQDMNIVVAAAIRNRQCKTICISNNRITAEGITTLVRGMRGSTTLVGLDLSNSKLSDLDVQPFATELTNDQMVEVKQSAWGCCRKTETQQDPPIKSLDLSHNNIGDAGARDLATMIDGKRTLICLRLNHNRIGDRGVDHLANALSKPNVQLQKLYLNNNALITDGSQTYLMKILKENQSLNTLWLTNCGLTGTVRKTLNEVAKSKKNFVLFMDDASS